MTLRTRVIPLDCASCGAPLQGLHSDAAFTCAPCRTAVSIDADGETAVVLRIAPTAQQTDLPVIHLPVYRFDIRCTILDEAGHDITTDSPAAQWTTAWVCGFQEFRPAYFGNPGYDMTASQIALLEIDSPGPGFRLVGIARPLRQAGQYPQVFVSAMLDRRKDISGLQIRVTPTNGELWAIPFAVDPQDESLISLVTGQRYPARIVETLDEMR